MSKGLKIILILGFGAGLLVFLYFFVKNMHKQTTQSLTKEQITITKDELNKQVGFTKNFYIYSKQSLSNYPTLENDVLQQIFEDKLVEEYASQNKIMVSDSEVQALYKQKLTNKTETQLLSQLKLMYGMEKSDYLNTLKLDLLKEKVQVALKIPLEMWLTEQKKLVDVKVIN